MSQDKLPEVWMRGPLPDVPAIVQPVAHALMQAREEIQALMINFPQELLWEKVAGMASPAFHLQHIAGVLSRLFTYADAKPLTTTQLEYLAAEGRFAAGITVDSLLAAFNNQVDAALRKLREIDESILTDFRGVGRKQLPSTVIGLLVHAAEHTMRHTGQLLVTVHVIKERHTL